MGANIEPHFKIDHYFEDSNLTIVFKPRCKIQEILKDAHNITASYTKQDYVLIYAGLQDCLESVVIDKTYLRNVLMSLQHTNTIIIGIPLYVHDSPVNQNIRVNNEILKYGADTFLSAFYIDINDILYAPKFTNYKLISINKEEILGKAIKSVIDTVYSMYFSNIIHRFM